MEVTLFKDELEMAGGVREPREIKTIIDLIFQYRNYRTKFRGKVVMREERIQQHFFHL